MTALLVFLLLQVDSLLKGISLPAIPTGFNWEYIALFVLGMVLHWLIRVIHGAGGWSKVFTVFNSSLLDNFVSWFFNKPHLTVVSGGAAAVLAFAAQYNLPVSFATINALGVAMAVASGYIADSAFNGGAITAPAGSTPLAPPVVQAPTTPAEPKV